MRCPRSGFTSFAPAVFVLLLFLANGRTADAQQVKSETYLMQLAAAVSGYSGGQRVWVVMCGTSDPYEVLGVYPSADAAGTAMAQATNRGKVCSLEGPYKTNETYANGATTYGSGCKKAPDSSCQSDTSRATIQPLSDLVQVSVTYTLRNGQTVVDRFRPRDVEAIFFTMAAVDRLLIPYYTRLRGVDYARGQRQGIACRFRVRLASGGAMAPADTTCAAF